MPDQAPFDVAALYTALDEKRTSLALSWTAVAGQLWELSSELNDRRSDHPISPSTLTNMAKNPRISCQWNQLSPEQLSLVGAGCRAHGQRGRAGRHGGRSGADLL